MNINIKKVGILGCGWLGLPLAEKLMELGFQVVGSTTRIDRLELLNTKGIEAYLLNIPNEISNLNTLTEVDYLIINIPPGRKNPSIAIDFPSKINQILKHIGTNTKFIFVSSTSVYGANEGVVSELEKPLPITASGKALRAVETFIEEKYFKEKMGCVVRPGGLVGPDRRPGRFLAGRKNLPNGDAPINLVHQEDVIHILIEIIQQDKFGEVFNLSADAHPTKSEFYFWGAEKLGLEPPSFLSGGQTSKEISNAKVKSKLNYQFVYADPYKM